MIRGGNALATRIVIIGGSFAGFETAVQLHRLLKGGVHVTVIDRNARFEFRPSLPWLVFDRRRPEQISVPLSPLVEAQGAVFVQDEVESIDADAARVHGRDRDYAYDFLVVATGGTSPPKQPPALTDRGFTLMWLDDAHRLRAALADFRGGSVVIAFHPRSPLACAAYELPFQLVDYLRDRGIARGSSVSLVTYEDEPFAAGGPAASRIIGRRLQRAGVRFYPNTFVKKTVARGVMLASRHVLAADLLVYIPTYRGLDLLRNVGGLTDTDGFVITDRTMRTHAYPNIFAAGDGVAFPGPKTGLMAEAQAKVVATNIAADLGVGQHTEYDSLLMCLLDFGSAGGLMVARKPAPQQGWTRTYGVLPGVLPRFGKYAFERYFLHRRLGKPFFMS